MRSVVRILLSAAFVLFVAASASALTVDQQQLTDSEDAISMTLYPPQFQTFTAGQPTSQGAAFHLQGKKSAVVGTATVYLLKDVGGAPDSSPVNANSFGSLSYSLAAGFADGWFDVTWVSNVPVTVGNKYWLEIQHSVGTPASLLYDSDGTVYAGGKAYTTAIPTPWITLNPALGDLAFKAYGVPEPSTIVGLIGMAAMGAVWFWRRRK